jgi:RNA polymerase sigma-70 factor (ECF subfamily)
LHDFARSEEVTQEVYVQVWLTGAKRFDADTGSGWAYLKTVARRRAIDQLRQREAHRRHDTILGARTEQESVDLAESAVTRLQLNSALAGLGERSSRVLALYYYLDRSHAEIAALLAMPIGTVKSHHHRALQALRSEFRQSAPEVRE